MRAFKNNFKNEIDDIFLLFLIFSPFISSTLNKVALYADK